MKAFHFCIFLLLFGSAPAGLFSQKATAVAAVSITVENLDREVAFFTEALGFQKIKEETWTGKEAAELFDWPDESASVQIVTLQLGDEQIRLLDFHGIPSRPVAPDARSNDLWFQHLAIVVSDMETAYRQLLTRKVVHVSTAPQTLPDYLPNAAGIKAFYFRDPEGHNLELIWFPPGKGAAKWQETVAEGSSSGQRSEGGQPRPLFLGIDHTAIAIADTDNSLAFYRDRLGLVHGGHSENYGPEQEHLNQVFGARLDINGLHADIGPGVEFLQYIAPPGGRPYPADSKAWDLWHYHTEMEVDDLDALVQKLEKPGVTRVSRRIAGLSGTNMVMVRDPDGHAVLLKSRQKPQKG